MKPFIKIKNIWQKLTRGFDDNDIWNLDHDIAKYTLPRLKEFRKQHIHTHPSELNNIDEWYEIIDKMIYAFEGFLDDDYDLPEYEVRGYFEDGSYKSTVIKGNRVTFYNAYRSKQEKIQEGFNLFGKYFMNLWD